MWLSVYEKGGRTIRWNQCSIYLAIESRYNATRATFAITKRSCGSISNSVACFEFITLFRRDIEAHRSFRWDKWVTLHVVFLNSFMLKEVFGRRRRFEKHCPELDTEADIKLQVIPWISNQFLVRPLEFPGFLAKFANWSAVRCKKKNKVRTFCF